MKLSFPRLALALTALSFVVSGHAAPGGKTDAVGGESGGVTTIPGGTQTATYVITKSGSYVLGGDRQMSNLAAHNIEIQAPDVTLDLGGFALSHPAGSASTGSGIHLEAVENVEIRHGSILNAAYMGVRAKTGKGLRLIDLRVSGSKNVGIESLAEDTFVERSHVADSGAAGVSLSGKASVVQDTIVTNSGGTGVAVGWYSRVVRTTVRGATNGIWLRDYSTLAESHVSQATSAGVWVNGSFCTIRANSIVHNSRLGVSLAPGVTHTEVTGNTIASTLASNGTQIGVNSASLTNVLAQNRLGQNGTNISGAYTNAGGNVLQ